MVPNGIPFNRSNFLGTFSFSFIFLMVVFVLFFLLLTIIKRMIKANFSTGTISLSKLEEFREKIKGGELKPGELYNPDLTIYKSRRDELISLIVEDVNFLRKGTSHKLETKANLAKRLNKNPFLAGKANDGELFFLYQECHEKKNYSKIYWLLKNPKLSTSK